MDKNLAVLNPAPSPEGPDVFVDLGDGKQHQLRYSVKSLKRMKQKLKRPMLGAKGQLLELDEELIPELIWEGLRGPSGEDPTVTIEQIENLPARYFSHLLNAFLLAFTGSLPEKNETAATPPATA